MKKIPAPLLVCCLCLLLSISLLRVSTASGATAVMPPFSLESVTDGARVDSKQFHGKVLLITFFATWCPPCIEEIPGFIDIQKQFAEQGFSVVAMAIDQTGPADVAKLVKKMSINYPVLMANQDMAQEWGVFGIPTSFLVNRAGNVVKAYRQGYVPSKVFVKDIKKELN